MSKLFRLFPFLILMSGIYFFPVSNVFAEGENGTEKNDVDISISPKDALFDISNMKPGDWAPRTITVENSGIKDFVYQIKVKTSGEKKLFNELILEVVSNDEELYQGKLAAFNSLPARNLTSGAEEDLDITIRFPEHLGNDFQGLKSAFVFTFTAEEKGGEAAQAMVKGIIDSGGPTTAGFTLPTTSASVFSLLLFGAVLVAGGIVFRRKRI